MYMLVCFNKIENKKKTPNSTSTSTTQPPLTEKHKLAHLGWAKYYMKTDFQFVLFRDE